MKRLLRLTLCLAILLVACGQREPSTPASATAAPATPAKEIVVFTPTRVTAVVAEKNDPEPVAVEEPLVEIAATEVVVSPPAPSQTPTSTLTLPIEQFFESAFQRMLIRDPEAVTSYALADEYGWESDSNLTDESPLYRAESYQIMRDVLAELRTYEPGELTAEEQLSLQIFDWYLDDVVAREPHAYHDYLLNPVFGTHFRLYRHLLSEHPLDDVADAQAYISRLEQVDDKFAQVVDSAEFARSNGIIPPRITLEAVRGQMRSLSQGGYQQLADHLAQVVADMPIDSAEKERLTQAAQTAVDEVAIPALDATNDYLIELIAESDFDVGAWKHPDGGAFYAAALRHHTTTNLTAEEIHQIGLGEVDRISAKIQARFTQLDYPKDTVSNNMNRVATDGGLLPMRNDADREAVLAEYERLIREAETAVAPYFDLLPQAELALDYELGGAAYYLPPATDGSRAGTFFASLGGSQLPSFGMPTLSYHEAVPGHHFQIALQQELDGLPRFRNLFIFTAYVEGWALYAEQLAAEIGLYDDDVYGDIGRLQMEQFRAVRLVVDTGIHAKRWTREEAVDYMIEHTGLPSGMVQREIDRYIAWPGQATAYKIGQLKILELREHAQAMLGDAFELRNFHNLVLQNGAMPLSILEQVVDAYISSVK